ncbi:MAG TPA: response regulator transcription factor [Thermoanaerobaculia bacterium]|jgi:two-component system NarL family response regulator
MMQAQFERIHLVLVDDHAIIRQGLRALFGSHRDIEVIGEACDAASLASMARLRDCDVALIDLRLQHGSGLDVLRTLRAHNASCRAVMLTSYGTEADVCAALDAGAFGYVLKHSDPTEIVAAVRAAYARRRYLSPGAATALADAAHTARLTDREEQVLHLLVPGRRNKDIARTLGVTEETVKGHVKNILSKLGVRDRTEAATRAIQRGLVRVD